MQFWKAILAPQTASQPKLIQIGIFLASGIFVGK